MTDNAIEEVDSDVVQERLAAWAKIEEELRYLVNLHSDKEGVRRSVEVIREQLRAINDCMKTEGLRVE